MLCLMLLQKCAEVRYKNLFYIITYNDLFVHPKQIRLGANSSCHFWCQKRSLTTHLWQIFYSQNNNCKFHFPQRVHVIITEIGGIFLQRDSSYVNEKRFSFKRKKYLKWNWKSSLSFEEWGMMYRDKRS